MLFRSISDFEVFQGVSAGRRTRGKPGCGCFKVRDWDRWSVNGAEIGCHVQRKWGSKLPMAIWRRGVMQGSSLAWVLMMAFGDKQLI